MLIKSIYKKIFIYLTSTDTTSRKSDKEKFAHLSDMPPLTTRW